MTYSPTFGNTAAQADPFTHTEVHLLKVEFIMDSHRVCGELRYSGPPRRVVDMLNAIDTGYVMVYDGVVDNAARPGEGARSFKVAQVRRDAIMVAIPRTDTALPEGAFESVKKVPTPSTVVIPGYEISGKIYLVAEADPATTPVLSTRHFTPITDATVTPAFDGVSFKEEIVIVNLACALFYAPNTRSA